MFATRVETVGFNSFVLLLIGCRLTLWPHVMCHMTPYGPAGERASHLLDSIKWANVLSATSGEEDKRMQKHKMAEWAAILLKKMRRCEPEWKTFGALWLICSHFSLYFCSSLSFWNKGVLYCQWNRRRVHTQMKFSEMDDIKWKSLTIDNSIWVEWNIKGGDDSL